MRQTLPVEVRIPGPHDTREAPTYLFLYRDNDRSCEIWYDLAPDFFIAWQIYRDIPVILAESVTRVLILVRRIS